MKNNFFLLFICTTLIYSCSSNDVPNDHDYSNTEYFEGKITYVNTFTSFTKQTPKELVSIYGDTILVSYKDGNYKQQYNSSAIDGIRELIYNKENNEVYMKIGESDTFQSFNATTSGGRKLYNHFLRTNQDTILELACDAVIFESAYETPARSFNITSEFFFHPSLRINPEDWKQHRFSYFDKFAALSESFYLKYTYTDHEAFSYIQEAINIKKETIDLKEFNKPLLIAQ